MSPALQYNATMKYEDWMRGSILAFESNIKLCAKQAILTTAVVNNRILQDPDVEIVQLPIPPKLSYPVLTTAEKLAQDYDFLADESTRSEFDEENRSNAVSILFKTGSATLLPEYRNNSRNLDLLVDIILKINQSPDSRISHILIAGYASPDGDIRINSDFATLRAAALKKYLMRHTRLDSGTFEVINGKIDWYGLSRWSVNPICRIRKRYSIFSVSLPSREARANVQKERTYVPESRSPLPLYAEELLSGTPFKHLYQGILRKK